VLLACELVRRRPAPMRYTKSGINTTLSGAEAKAAPFAGFHPNIFLFLLPPCRLIHREDSPYPAFDLDFEEVNGATHPHCPVIIAPP